MNRAILVCLPILALATACGANSNHDSLTTETVAAADPLSSLRAAVEAADIPEFTDYNRDFALQTYPAGTTAKAIVAGLTGVAPDELDSSLFEMLSGEAAVGAFTEVLTSYAADEEELEAGIYERIAAETRNAFLPASRYADVQLWSHGISEDGDVEYQILMTQTADGSLVVLSYSNFPF